MRKAWGYKPSILFKVKFLFYYNKCLSVYFVYVKACVPTNGVLFPSASKMLTKSNETEGHEPLKNLVYYITVNIPFIRFY